MSAVEVPESPGTVAWLMEHKAATHSEPAKRPGFVRKGPPPCAAIYTKCAYSRDDRPRLGPERWLHR